MSVVSVSTSTPNLAALVSRRLGVERRATRTTPLAATATAPLMLSALVWDMFRGRNPIQSSTSHSIEQCTAAAMLRETLSSNRLASRVGVLVGRENPEEGIFVDSFISLISDDVVDSISKVVHSVLNDEHRSVVGWYVCTMGVGVSVPMIELETMRACVCALDECLPKGLECLLVVDILKSYQAEEAHLECYNICNLLKRETLSQGDVAVPMEWGIVEELD